MVCIRSSVIDIEAMIASICWPSSAGMMPSQAVGTISHSSSAASQTALMISISQPCQLPPASGLAKGG
jgi:hypothetical protein